MWGSLGTIRGHFGCTLETLWGVGAQEQELWSQSPPGQAEPWQQNCAHIACRRLLCAPASSKPPPCLETYVSKAEKCLHVCILLLMRGRKGLGCISCLQKKGWDLSGAILSEGGWGTAGDTAQLMPRDPRDVELCLRGREASRNVMLPVITLHGSSCLCWH